MKSDRPSLWTVLGRVLLTLLLAAGAFSGGFLLLNAWGIVDAAQVAQTVTGWFSPPATAPAAAPVTGLVEKAAPFHALVCSGQDLEDILPAAQDYDGVVFDLKTDEGLLGYVSALPLAADCAASASDPGLNDAWKALNQTPELYTVARISCFRDGLLCAARPELALRRVSGCPWTDGEALPWLDPENETVRAYLTGVCREAAALGFDEILLANCCYPPRGNLALLTPEEGRTQKLEAFCRTLQQDLASYNVKLSVQGEEDALSAFSPSGQTAALLSSFPGRIWLEEGTDLAAVFANQSPVVFRDAPGKAEESWAVLSPEK